MKNIESHQSSSNAPSHHRIQVLKALAQERFKSNLEIRYQTIENVMRSLNSLLEI